MSVKKVTKDLVSWPALSTIVQRAQPQTPGELDLMLRTVEAAHEWLKGATNMGRTYAGCKCVLRKAMREGKSFADQNGRFESKSGLYGTRRTPRRRKPS